ncbi:MAG: insulinase family protein [Coriobacteriales bacterium]|nr:insulinase family protein [Coriobacteriales bacterium]
MFYESTTLDNGVNVVSEHMDGVRSLSLGIWFRVGSRDETADQLGISHFMEHMMFKGTEKRSTLDISMAFDAMGAELNAFTSKEYTCYYARILDQNLDRAFEILGDMVCNSVFSQDEINSEREVVIEEIARSEDVPDDHIFDVFTEAMFPSHPLGRPVAGTREIVGAFKHEDCVAYHEKHYHAGNVTVVASGSVDHAKLVELCEKYLGSMKPGTANDRGAVPPQDAKSQAFVQKETEQAHLLYGLPGIPLGDDDRFAGKLMETALGGPMSSRLFQEVREKRGLAYAVFSTTLAYMNAAQFAVYCGTRAENLEQVVTIVREQLELMLNKGVDKDELERVRQYVLGQTILGMEATRSRMTRLGGALVNGLPVLSLDEIIERYNAVTQDDIMRVANRVLTGTPTVAVISPRDTDELKAALA